MEEEKKNHIDQLFKSKLGDSETLPPDDIWEGIESAIPKSLFFRFRYEQMNVYYSGMIICCFLFSAASLVFQVKRYYQTQEQVTPNNTYGIIDAKVNKKENSSDEEQQTRKSRKKRFYAFGQQEIDAQTGEPLTSGVGQDTMATIQNHIKPDSSSQVLKPLNTDMEQKPKEKKIKKVVYIMDYDTVVNYDTLRTKRKRR